MTALTLSGYVTIVDDSKILISGDNSVPFSHLTASYWSPGICRHVSKDRRECTIKTTPETVYERSGQECKRADIAGCYVGANVRVKKYKFFPKDSCKGDNVAVEGWQIIAVTIKQKSPLIVSTRC
jgi:hypothetical protein